MFNLIIISIVLLKIGIISTFYLEDQNNFLKPRLERNNIINKGVWIKGKPNDRHIEKSNLGNFIFRENSLDGENVLQNNFYAFSENNMQDPPFVSNYVERAKRGTSHVRKRRFRKSLTKNSKEDNSAILKSKLVTDLKPASVFNDYPYEVAILLSNNKSELDPNEELKNAIKAKMNRTQFKSAKNLIKVNHNELGRIENTLAVKEIGQLNNINITEENNNMTVPKRSMKHDYESEVIKKIEFTEAINDTGDNLVVSKSDRSVFEKDGNLWVQNLRMPDTDKYDVIPKVGTNRNRPVTERGLLKIISMLTKTFKKIMKQHHEIKAVHKKLHSLNEDFTKNCDIMTNKFQEFDAKYLSLMKFSEKLKSFERLLNNKEEYFNNQQKAMSTNLIEFENQQKKFLAQQRQFYNVQKLMLKQNENISVKQNLIAKTQSEISHRQNNFARILKKASQMYFNSRNPEVTKVNSAIKAKENIVKADNFNKIMHTTTSAPSTESIKINLFAIPISNRIENQDDIIIKEKDEHPIDDLVYKYYFNNTFIDNFMKTKVLSSFITAPQHTDITRNAKNKRNQLATTILLPISKENLNEVENGALKRERRWIRKLRRKTRGKANVPNPEINDEKRINPKKNDSVAEELKVVEITEYVKNNKDDPFMKMATSFCNEIGQNKTRQIMNWCIEKALRRLKFIDIKLFSPLPITPSNEKKDLKPLSSSIMTQYVPNLPANGENGVPSISSTPSTSSGTTTFTPLYTMVTEAIQASNVFFPDNDELESNLKQFELTPDTEGNFYYDGSVHTSDIVSTDSEGYSGFMPGMDSNSKLDMDPMAFDLQLRRRAYVQRFNENILNNMKL